MRGYSMKYIGFLKVDQQFFDDMNEHFKRNYLYIRHMENQHNGEICIVFFIKHDLWGFVLVKDYDFYVEIGKESYFNYVDEIIRKKLGNLPIFRQDLKLYKTNKLQEVLPIVNYIKKNEHLRKLNSHRSRNFILYNNSFMNLVYDSVNQKLNFLSNIPFSDIEYDTNRILKKFALIY